MIEHNKLLYSVQRCERIGNLKTRDWTPHEELAFAIVELAISDYKQGVSSLLDSFGRPATKKIMKKLKFLSSEKDFLKSYKRSIGTKKESYGTYKHMYSTIFKEIRSVVGDKAKENIAIIPNVFDMVTAMIFFNERNWCENLVDVDGVKILKTLEISQKLQAA